MATEHQTPNTKHRIPYSVHSVRRWFIGITSGVVFPKVMEIHCVVQENNSVF